MSTPGTQYTIACLQTAPAFGEVEQNLDAVEAALRGVTADLVVLPELFASGYSFRDRDEAFALAESYTEGESVRRLVDWSRATGGLVVAGYPERDDNRVYNAAAVVADGERLQTYRKLHLFGFEGECFDVGDRPLQVVEHRGLRVGTMICFDWIFPEACRILALQGADVIAHPSNLVLPGLCQRAMEVRALENRVYCATANRYGEEHRKPRPRLAFTGRSQIVSPGGAVLAAADAEGDALATVAVDVAEARTKQIASGNDVFRDRRPEWYRDLVQRRPDDGR